MKSLFTFLAVGVFFCSTVHAQITVTSATLPAANDTLKTTVTFEPTGISVGNAGGNQTWNWSSLVTTIIRRNVYLPASQGSDPASFPDANLVLKVLGTTIAESYYSTAGGDLALVGYKGNDPLGFGVAFTARVIPPQIERNYPMTMGSTAASTSNILVPFDADQLPDTILSQFPIQPDSIRVRISLDRNDVIDAWGTMTVSGETYPVLRQKRTDVQNTIIEAKLPFIGWLDVTSVLGNTQFLGEQTTISYQFYNDVEKSFIAEATMDSTGTNISTVEFIAGTPTHTVQAPTLQGVIQQYPNPAHTHLTFETGSLPSGTYSLSLYTQAGKRVSTQQHILVTNTTLTLPLAVQSGNYVAVWRNAKGELVSTQSFVVQK